MLKRSKSAIAADPDVRSVFGFPLHTRPKRTLSVVCIASSKAVQDVSDPGPIT